MKLSMDEIHLMNALEQVAKTTAKDCILEDNMVSFLVDEKDVGKAIGKKAGNVKELQKKLNKKVEIIGYSENPAETAAKALGIEVSSAKKKGDRLIIGLDSLNRKKALSSGPKMRRIKKFVKRNYGTSLVVA